MNWSFFFFPFTVVSDPLLHSTKGK